MFMKLRRNDIELNIVHMLPVTGGHLFSQKISLARRWLLNLCEILQGFLPGKQLTLQLQQFAKRSSGIL